MMAENPGDRQLVERLMEGDATAVPELQTTYGGPDLPAGVALHEEPRGC